MLYLFESKVMSKRNFVSFPTHCIGSQNEIEKLCEFFPSHHLSNYCLPNITNYEFKSRQATNKKIADHTCHHGRRYFHVRIINNDLYS